MINKKILFHYKNKNYNDEFEYKIKIKKYIDKKIIIDNIINNFNNIDKYNNIKQFDINNKVNLNYIKHEFIENCHRSGWCFVMKYINNYFHDDKADLILDSYVDATFLWNYNKFKDKLPYKKNWLGIIHHTPNTTYSENNVYNILNNTIFQKSLINCKGIIVLSKYLKKYIKKKLLELGYDINIYVIYHPTLFVNKFFKITNFINNDNKKVIQIGGWMRNPYAIYKLDLDSSIQKCALKGLYMDNYFKPNNLDYNILFTHINMYTYNNNVSSNNICSNNISNYILKNKYMEELINFLNEKNNSVQIINYLNNEEYDNLLNKNIVFIYLYDASACNTLIECVVRNTPIIINKLPAVVEILGNEYPLYYNTIKEASNIIDELVDDNNNKLLYKTYNYMNFKIDKKKLYIETFIKKLKKLIY
jgi:hypothetical protein